MEGEHYDAAWDPLEDNTESLQRLRTIMDSFQEEVGQVPRDSSRDYGLSFMMPPSGGLNQALYVESHSLENESSLNIDSDHSAFATTDDDFGDDIDDGSCASWGIKSRFGLEDKAMYCDYPSSVIDGKASVSSRYSLGGDTPLMLLRPQFNLAGRKAIVVSPKGLLKIK